MSRWTPRVTSNCDNGRHRHCTGCEGCPCHHVPPPANFRQLVQLVAALRENHRPDRNDQEDQ